MTKENADFASFMLNDEATIQIDLPNGQPMCYPAGTDNQVAITVYSPATPQYAAAKAEFDREATKRAMAAAGVKDKKHSENKFAEADFLAAITKEVHNFPFPGGAQGIYRTLALKYVGDQVNSYVNDLGNFFGGGKTN